MSMCYVSIPIPPLVITVYGKDYRKCDKECYT